MRSGRHFVQFTVTGDAAVYFGAIRPGWGVEGDVMWNDDNEGAAHSVGGHCFYGTYDGWSFHLARKQAWEGRQAARSGDCIGMLLDLDQGSMTVWKDDVKMGVMVAEGLIGYLAYGDG